MNRAISGIQLLLVALGGVALVLAWHWNSTRHHQGPIVFQIDQDHGLHRMDVRLIALAACLWAIGVVLAWAKDRTSQ